MNRFLFVAVVSLLVESSVRAEDWGELFFRNISQGECDVIMTAVSGTNVWDGNLNYTENYRSVTY